MTFDDEKTIGATSAFVGSFLLLLNIHFDPNWWIVGGLLCTLLLGFLVAALKFRKLKSPTSAFYHAGFTLFLLLTLNLSYMVYIVVTRMWGTTAGIAFVPFWLIVLILEHKAVVKASPAAQQPGNHKAAALIGIVGAVLGGYFFRPGAAENSVQWLFLFVNTSLALMMLAIASLCIRRAKEIERPLE